MRAIVTGCAGFIGSHLTESLLESGHEVCGVDCFTDNYSRSEKLRNLERARAWDTFQLVSIDIAEGGLERIVEGRDVVFHLAAEPGVRLSWGPRFWTYVRNNVMATQSLLEATRAQPDARVVYASSSSVYGQAERFPTPEHTIPAPFSPYGMSKLAAEHLLGVYERNFGLDVVTLRYFSVYGPRQRPDMAFNIFCRRIHEGQPITLFGGDQTRDFTFVEDVVRATRDAAERPEASGRVYNIGGGSRTSLREVVDLLAEVSERPVEVHRVQSQDGDVRDTGADISAASLELEYAPSVPIEEGLRAEWDWITSVAREPARSGVIR